MSDDEKGYNGWTNYETWSVALIIDNDQWLYNQRRELVKEAAAQALIDKPDYFSEKEARRFFVADVLKEWVEDAMPDLVNDANPMSYLWSQLLTAAFSEVHWFEIADHYLSELADA